MLTAGSGWWPTAAKAANAALPPCWPPCMEGLGDKADLRCGSIMGCITTPWQQHCLHEVHLIVEGLGCVAYVLAIVSGQ
eukprot:scaffold120492_cov18-Tisochrysis_lutea.AAC.2